MLFCNVLLKYLLFCISLKNHESSSFARLGSVYLIISLSLVMRVSKEMRNYCKIRAVARSERATEASTDTEAKIIERRIPRGTCTAIEIIRGSKSRRSSHRSTYGEAPGANSADRRVGECAYLAATGAAARARVGTHRAGVRASGTRAAAAAPARAAAACSARTPRSRPRPPRSSRPLTHTPR